MHPLAARMAPRQLRRGVLQAAGNRLQVGDVNGAVRGNGEPPIAAAVAECAVQCTAAGAQIIRAQCLGPSWRDRRVDFADTGGAVVVDAANRRRGEFVAGVDQAQKASGATSRGDVEQGQLPHPVALCDAPIQAGEQAVRGAGKGRRANVQGGRKFEPPVSFGGQTNPLRQSLRCVAVLQVFDVHMHGLEAADGELDGAELLASVVDGNDGHVSRSGIAVHHPHEGARAGRGRQERDVVFQVGWTRRDLVCLADGQSTRREPMAKLAPSLGADGPLWMGCRTARCCWRCGSLPPHSAVRGEPRRFVCRAGALDVRFCRRRVLNGAVRRPRRRQRKGQRQCRQPPAQVHRHRADAGDGE